MSVDLKPEEKTHLKLYNPESTVGKNTCVPSVVGSNLCRHMCCKYLKLKGKSSMMMMMMMFKSTALLVCAVSNVSMVRSNICDAVEDKVQHQENDGESARRNGIIVRDWWCRWLVNWSRCQERLFPVFR